MLVLPQKSYLKEVGKVTHDANNYSGKKIGDHMGQDTPLEQYSDLTCNIMCTHTLNSLD